MVTDPLGGTLLNTGKEVGLNWVLGKCS